MALQKEDTKNKLIRAALDLFWEKGIEEVSFQEITAKVGVSQPAAYKYFSSKMDLFMQVALYSAGVGRAFIDERKNLEANAQDSLREYISANIEFFVKRKKEAFGVLGLYFFGTSEKSYNAVFTEVQNVGIQRISYFLQRGIHERVWRLKNVEEAATLIHSLMVGELYKALHAKNKSEVAALEKRLLRAVDLLLNS